MLLNLLLPLPVAPLTFFLLLPLLLHPFLFKPEPGVQSLLPLLLLPQLFLPLRSAKEALCYNVPGASDQPLCAPWLVS